MQFSLLILLITLVFTGCAPKNGLGEKSYKNGTYKGNFYKSKRSGYGTLNKYDGLYVYKGYWNNDKKHGKGILRDFKETFEGKFENGYKKSGKLIVYSKYPKDRGTINILKNDSKEILIYEGPFGKYGDINSHGTNGLKHGYYIEKKGVFTLGNGIKYEAYWHRIYSAAIPEVKGQNIVITLKDKIIKGSFTGNLLKPEELKSTKGRYSYKLKSKVGNTIRSEAVKDGIPIDGSVIITYTKPFIYKYKNLEIEIPAGSTFKGYISQGFKREKGELLTSDGFYIIKGDFTKNPKIVKTKKRANIEKISKYLKNEKCKVLNKDYIYLGKACKKGKAHGYGKAIYKNNLEHTFVGTFKNGFITKGTYHTKKRKYVGSFINIGESLYFDKRVKSYTKSKESISTEVIKDGELWISFSNIDKNFLLFDGVYKNGKIEGKAKCFYKNSYEECIYKNGKRVDNKYILRQKEINRIKKQRAYEQRLAIEKRKRKSRLAREKEERERRLKKQKREREARLKREKEKREMEERRARIESDSSSSLFSSSLLSSLEKASQKFKQNSYNRNLQYQNALNTAKKIQRKQERQKKAAYEERLRKLALDKKKKEARRKAYYENQKRELERKRKLAYKKQQEKLALQKAQRESKYKSYNKSSYKKQKKEKKTKEVLAYCWQNKHGYWNCDGKTQKTLVGEKDLKKQLGYVHCKNYRKSVPFKDGKIFFCGYNLGTGSTAKMTWNRDIRGWYNIPSSW